MRGYELQYPRLATLFQAGAYAVVTEGSAQGNKSPAHDSCLDSSLFLWHPRHAADTQLWLGRDKFYDLYCSRSPGGDRNVWASFFTFRELSCRQSESLSEDTCTRISRLNTTRKVSPKSHHFCTKCLIFWEGMFWSASGRSIDPSPWIFFFFLLNVSLSNSLFSSHLSFVMKWFQLLLFFTQPMKNFKCSWKYVTWN